MGASSSKAPRYDVVNPLASSSGSPRPQVGSFSPPTQGLVQPQNSQWAPVQQAPPPPLPASWDFAIDPATGYPYFFHTQLQISQWDDPRGPGYGLPERSAASTSGDSQRVVPPWEGGPVSGVDPLTWPLPPGWQEQLDMATNQRYFVNYDARIMSYNDPRLEIAKAYRESSTALGIPSLYPAPAYGRVVDTSYHHFSPPPAFGSAGAQSPGHQPIQQTYPPPPPPGNRKESLWSRLGYRHGSGRMKHNRPLHLGLLSGVYNFGRPGSSSSSSSDDSDNEGDGGGDDAASGLLLAQQTFPSGSDDDHPSFDLGGTGLGSGDGGLSDGESGDFVGGGGGQDSIALEEYGLFLGDGGDGGGGDIFGGGSGGNGSEGISAGDYFPVQSLRPWDSQEKHTSLKVWSNASKCHRHKFWIPDGYSRLSIFLTVMVGLYFGAFEGFLSLLFASAARLVVSLHNSYIVIRARRKTMHGIRNITRWAMRKGSMLTRLMTSVSTILVQTQAWFYEHMYDHPLVKLRVLTAKDEAGPLHSRLPLRPREITIVTQASADRLLAIEAMATSWGGAMCVVFYITSKAELKQLYQNLCAMHNKVEAQGRCRLHICVATEEGPLADTQAQAPLYPVNALRNLALRMATTELVFILDADFVPSQRMHEILTGDDKLYSGLLQMAVEERHLLVIPAFEARTDRFEDWEISKAAYPTTFQELFEKWIEGAATAFHCSHFARGHKPTNYERFFNPSTCGPYKVQYREYYEPYAICARNLIPPFDARFRGYGMNKISHAYHCAAKGMGFTVLPHMFVWSLPHRKSQAWTYTFGANKDPVQKLRILGLYRRFKGEVQKERRFNLSLVDRVKAELLEVRVEPPPQSCRIATNRREEVQSVVEGGSWCKMQEFAFSSLFSR